MGTAVSGTTTWPSRVPQRPEAASAARASARGRRAADPRSGRRRRTSRATASRAGRGCRARMTPPRPQLPVPGCRPSGRIRPIRTASAPSPAMPSRRGTVTCVRSSSLYSATNAARWFGRAGAVAASTALIAAPRSGRRLRDRRRAAAPRTGGRRAHAQGRERMRESPGVRRVELERLGPVELHADDDSRLEQCSRKHPRPVGAHADPHRPVVHQCAQLAEVAGGREAALRHDEDLRADALDLVEDVAGDDDATSFAPEPAEQRDHLHPLTRVETGERLVEDEHLRVVDEGLGDLHPLAHALRVRRQAARVGRVEIDDLSAASAAPSGSGRPCSRAENTTNSCAVSGSKTVSCCGTSPMRRVDARDPSEDPGRGRGPCPWKGGRARRACGTSSTSRRRSGRAAQ